MITVVVPTLNSSASLAILLESLALREPEIHEVVVVDRCSSDDTLSVAKRFRARVIQGPWNRAEARNVGVRESTGDPIFFLDADMEIREPIFTNGVTALAHNDAVIIREVVAFGTNYWARCRSLERDAYFGSLFFESARGFRRDCIERLGGYNPKLSGLEDMDIQARLLEGGYSVTWLKTPIVHHEEEVGLLTYLRKRHQYAASDEEFSVLHPMFARVLRSPKRRLRAILPNFRRQPLFRLGMALPGLLFIRGIEWFLRSTSSSKDGLIPASQHHLNRISKGR